MLKHNDDNFQIYPTHRVVAFFNNKVAADTAIKELINQGFKDDVIDESVGKDGLKFLDPDAQHHGFLNKVIRTWHKLAKGEEKAYVDNVRSELTTGHVLVSVPALDHDTCLKIAGILKNSKGYHIRYYGIFHVENLD